MDVRRGEVDAVLGLSVTPSAVGLVLVEGQDADGATMDRDAFEVSSRRRPSALQTCEQAAAAVLRTEATAAARGHRLHSIGVTWSDDADTEASLLLKSLTDSGFDNVVPVRLPEATEALAWGIAEVIGHETTAVCVIEPETVITLIVHARDGAVQTAVNHAIGTEEQLIGWLSAVFARADWQPEALVVVGSGGDEALMPRLEDVLSVPVFAPAEAELALARGAALASAHNTELAFEDAMESMAQARAQDRRRRPLAQTGPLALLVAGVVTFVVSLSIAISLQLTPKNEPEARPAANTSAEVPAAVTRLPPTAAIPAPVAAPPVAPPPHAPPIEVAPPPVEVPVEPPVSGPEAPEFVSDAPPADLPAPVDTAPLEPGMVPPPIAPAPPLPEQVAPPALAPEPVERPGILRRIKDRLSGIGDDEVVPAETLPPAPPAPLTEPPLFPPP
ncbi:DUF7159 family protein [Mycobacterium sp.]|uniref:DUF7159 family protein n=1 Tax=Mycobacterium sp. TaxID=1785 RepID=UPI00333EAF88